MTETVFRGGERPRHQIRPDLKGTVMPGVNVTLVRWVIEHGRAPTGMHSHAEHEQFTIVLSGSIEIQVGEETFVLGPGDVCRIARQTLHGRTRALYGADAVLIDVFEPARDDYIAAALKHAPSPPAAD